jgi:hypothetical protein
VIVWVKLKLKRKAVKAGQAEEQAKRAGTAGRQAPIKRRALSLIRVRALNSRTMEKALKNKMNDSAWILFGSFFICSKNEIEPDITPIKKDRSH